MIVEYQLLIQKMVQAKVVQEEKLLQAILKDMDVQVEQEIQEVHITYGMDVLGGYNGANGTGGLLIIYGNEIQNSGHIKSNGTGTTIHPSYATGGSSGGGSVNVFYKFNYSNTGTVETIGGIAGNGGSGGDGTATIGSILTGNFEKIVNDN